MAKSDKSGGKADSGSGSKGDGRSAPPDWRSLHLWQIQPVRDVLLALVILGVLALGYKLSIVTVPILLAMALAYMFEPLVKWMTKPREGGKAMSREIAAGLIIATAAIVVVVPVSLGIVFGVAQGIQVAGRAAEAGAQMGHVLEAWNERDVLGSPFDESGNFTSFDPVERAQQREADAPPDRAELPQDATGSAAQTAAESVLQLSDRIESQPADLTGEQATLAHRADEAWQGLGEYGFLRSVFGWALRLSDEEDAGESAVPQLLTWISTQLRSNSEVLVQLLVGHGVSAVQAVIKRVVSFGMLLFMGFLTAFFFFFFSTGYGKVLDFWRGLIPEAKKHRVVDLARQMDAVIAGFIRGRVTIAMLQAIFFTIAYWLIGVPAPLIIGPIVAILSIVPYVALIGVPITIIMMLVDPPGGGFQSAWWWTLGAPVAVYFAGQALDDYIFTPLIQGKSTDMDTPSILFASIAGGALAGVYGLLLAIPVAACLKILIREIFWPRFREWAEGKQKDFLPISRGDDGG